MYVVPIHNGLIPDPTVTAFLSYKNTYIGTFNRDYHRSFKPFVQIGLQPN